MGTRTYLGASAWAHCDRKMWLKFRRAFKVEYTPEQLRTFGIGKACEDVIVNDLRSRGIEVFDRQLEIHGEWGRALGHIDGKVRMPDGRVALLEMKTAKDQQYKYIVKNGLPDYYESQVQIYMRQTGLPECHYCLLNKNTSELAEPNIQYDAVYAQIQYDKMHRVMESEDMPPVDESYKCNMCEYKTFCKFGDLPQINCRTCANVSVVNGEFVCQHGDDVCDNHIIHPAFMIALGCTIEGADSVELAIDYGEIVHARAGYKHPTKNTFTSREYVEFFESAKQKDGDKDECD